MTMSANCTQNMNARIWYEQYVLFDCLHMSRALLSWSMASCVGWELWIETLQVCLHNTLWQVTTVCV